LFRAKIRIDLLYNFCRSEKNNAPFKKGEDNLEISQEEQDTNNLFLAPCVLETITILSEALPDAMDSERDIRGDNVNWLTECMAYIMK
jgi:hypothetical protein